MSPENEAELAAPDIEVPDNNSMVRNGEIDVSGTTSSQGSIFARLYTFSGSEALSQGQGDQIGSRWSARLPGTFAPGPYRIEVAQSGTAIIYVTLRVTPVVITTPPSGEVLGKQFVVRGAGGEHSVGTVTLYNASGDAILSSATIKTDGTWEATVTFPSQTQPLTFYAKQKIGNYLSSKSNQVTVILGAPSITSPKPDAVVLLGEILLKGQGTPGQYIDIKTPDGEILHGQAKVQPDGSWQTTFNKSNYPNGGTVEMTAGHRGMDDWSATQSFRIAIPLITTPIVGAITDPRGEISGTADLSGIVEVFKDLDHSFKVGQGTVENGQWRVTTFDNDMPVGPFSIVVKQTHDGLQSDAGAARAFKVRPPALADITVTFPTETSVEFSGTGHNGATVEITVVSGPGGTAPASVQVKDDKWETTATNWPIGTYSLKAIQRVSDNANGWIESQPYTFTVENKLQDPRDVTYTEDYQPTFAGKGLTGATVILYNPGGASKAAPDARVSNGIWSSRASEVWGPTFEREVHIQQTLNGQTSPNWVKLKVTIPPLAPVIDKVEEDGLSPKISGTCWSNAVVELTFSGSDTKWSAIVTGSNWTFQRDTPFAPDVTHTVSVTQTFARQTSPPASKTFVVYTPIPKPGITVPEPDSEVGHDVTIKGTSGMAGATMQLRDAQFGRNLGEPKLLANDGEWSIDLTGLAFREYTIDAQQTLNTRESERSDPCVFQVVLLPPVIEVPEEGGKLPRTSTLEGQGMLNGRVEVWLEGVAEPLLTNIPVDLDGRWKAEVTLPVGAKTIRASQTFEDQKSKDSQPLHYNVVPAAPFIETPATDEHIGRRVVVSGFGVPGDTVTVKLGDAAQTALGRSPVLEDRTWSVTVEFDQPGGLCSMVAVAWCDGLGSADSPGRPVVLGTYLPSIDVPAAGQWVSDPVRFEGQGSAGSGQVVSWFNPDQLWSPNFPVSTDGWQGGAVQLLPGGGNWCRFRQTLSDSADGATMSDWVESKRFEVLPPPT